MNRLNIIHNKAMRYITNSKFNTNINTMYCAAKCLKIQDIYKLNVAQFLFKQKNGQIIHPLNLHNEYSLRNNIIHSFNRTNIRQKHVYVAGPIIWSKFPTSIKNIQSLKKLKKELKSFFMSSY